MTEAIRNTEEQFKELQTVIAEYLERVKLSLSELKIKGLTFENLPAYAFQHTWVVNNYKIGRHIRVDQKDINFGITLNKETGEPEFTFQSDRITTELTSVVDNPDLMIKIKDGILEALLPALKAWQREQECEQIYQNLKQSEELEIPLIDWQKLENLSLGDNPKDYIQGLINTIFVTIQIFNKLEWPLEDIVLFDQGLFEPNSITNPEALLHYLYGIGHKIIDSNDQRFRLVHGYEDDSEEYNQKHGFNSSEVTGESLLFTSIWAQHPYYKRGSLMGGNKKLFLGPHILMQQGFELDYYPYDTGDADTSDDYQKDRMDLYWGTVHFFLLHINTELTNRTRYDQAKHLYRYTRGLVPEVQVKGISVITKQNPAVIADEGK